MNESLIKNIENPDKKFERISEILNIPRDEVSKMMKKNKDELIEIINTGRYTLASLKLLRWLGVKDEEIDVEKIMKGVAIVNSILTIINMIEHYKKINES